ncbi:MAG TPA: hypothetical protein VJN21_13375 [Candidatus Acidoferrales bacterium]|nr:hypothetical protein [Candidatus Acidoferrales bacterium]
MRDILLRLAGNHSPRLAACSIPASVSVIATTSPIFIVNHTFRCPKDFAFGEAGHIRGANKFSTKVENLNVFRAESLPPPALVRRNSFRITAAPAQWL